MHNFIVDFIHYFPFFLPAAGLTLAVSVLGILIGLMLGLLTAFMRISDKKIFYIPAKAYIYVIRGTPLLLQILFIYFGLRQSLHLVALTSAIMALGIHNGAYIAEIFRGSIQSVDKGQMEAARSLGMTYRKAMRRIILPQALKRSIPPLGNQFIIALKDSSLASAITIQELLLKAQQLAGSNWKTMTMLSIAAVFYLFYTSIFTWVFNVLEKHLDVDSRSEEVVGA